jgi:hypothetical protein
MSAYQLEINEAVRKIKDTLSELPKGEQQNVIDRVKDDLYL